MGRQYFSEPLKGTTMKSCFSLAVLSSLIISASTVQSSPVVITTSGILQGAEQDGVISFKGIPFALPPVGSLRWEPPIPLLSLDIRNATALGPACLQQFTFATQNMSEFLFNNPPPPGESEDCLFLNVWAPVPSTGSTKPVVVWIYGGSLQFGTGSLAVYDGTSFAKNQDIVIVTFNYRTNVFGFPGAEELFPFEENLGFLDQDLVLQWVQANIASFGGDPQRVTIMGESAGAESVAYLIQRHSENTPFRAAIMESGAAVSMLPTPNFSAFDAMAKAVNCTQSPGAARLSCLKAVPADAIKAWVNGPQGMTFPIIVDNVTLFTNPFQRIQQNMTARIPILIGANQDDGTVFTVGETSLSALLLGTGVSADQVRAIYPGLNDTQIIPTVFRDLVFNCPAELTSRAFVQSGIPNVFRYMYGAVFADLQLFPGAGAWHSSEIKEIFGTFNTTTATPAEATLSQTMQTVWANFIKDPTTSPAPNWERFLPGNNTNTLAKLAFQGNVQLSNVVEASPGNLDDGPCDAVWNFLLDF
ncbi:Carboxylesterase [Gautieria morchelliformis]|nr:Carboxylesterase [Gautieria morchelliformis]